jgi:hypothetical protein
MADPVGDDTPEHVQAEIDLAREDGWNQRAMGDASRLTDEMINRVDAWRDDYDTADRYEAYNLLAELAGLLRPDLYPNNNYDAPVGVPVGDDTPTPTGGQWTVSGDTIRHSGGATFLPQTWPGDNGVSVVCAAGGATARIPQTAHADLVALVRRAGAAPDLTALPLPTSRQVHDWLYDQDGALSNWGDDQLDDIDWTLDAVAALVREDTTDG